MAEEYNLEDLANAAKQGDADAQYRLAALLVQSGDEAERGVEWLRKAASVGHVNARYTLALMTLKGHYIDRKPARAVSLLETLIGAEHPPARQLLAVLYAQGTETRGGDWVKALGFTVDAAAQGDPGALKDIGLCLLLLDDNEAAFDWLMAAATRGDLMAAAALVAMFGDGDDRVDASVARTWAEGLARVGHPLAPVWAEHIKVDPTPEAPAVSDIPSLSGEARTALERAPDTAPVMHAFLERPRVDRRTEFLSRPLAAHVIGLARPYLQPAPDNPETSPLRALLGPAEMDLSLTLLTLRLSSVGGGQPKAMPLIVEALPPGAAGPITEGQEHGDAKQTAILSLSDVTDAGGLSFGGTADVVRGTPGTLFLLHHRLDDGALDAESTAHSIPGPDAVRWQALGILGA